MPTPPSRRLQTALAVAVAGVLCWAGLTFRPRRAEIRAWPEVVASQPDRPDGAAGFPKSVRHPDGTVARLAAPAQRLVLASTTLVDFVSALVPRARVAAVCAQAFTASALALEPERWRDVPTYDRFTAETVLSFHPDLVLCNDYNEPQTATALQRTGVPVVVLPGPTTLDECRRTLDLLGRVLGAERESLALQGDLERRVAGLAAAPPLLPRRRALCFTHNPTGSWTGGASTLHDEALRLAGLDNAAALFGITGHAALRIEQILAMDPDLLVLDAPVGGGRGTLQFLRENPTLGRLPALVAGHFVELHSALYATGSHSVLDAAETIAAHARAFFAESKR